MDPSQAVAKSYNSIKCAFYLFLVAVILLLTFSDVLEMRSLENKLIPVLTITNPPAKDNVAETTIAVSNTNTPPTTHATAAISSISSSNLIPASASTSKPSSPPHTIPDSIKSAKVQRIDNIKQEQLLAVIPRRFYLLAMIKSNAARYQGTFINVPRTVIAHIDPSKSECEIVYHVLSTFLFGIVSDRLILIDWSNTKIFPQSFMDQYDFNNTSSKYSLPLQKWIDQAVNVNANDIAKSVKLRRLDGVLNENVLVVSGSDWWAHGLFSSNLYPLQLEGLNPNRAFDILTAYSGINAGGCTQPPQEESTSPYIPYTKIEIKGAFVYLNYKPHKPEELPRSIGDLYRTFIPYFNKNYAVVLLVDDKTKYDHLIKQFPQLRIIIDEVDPNEWAVDLPLGSYPEVWKPEEKDIKSSFTLGYRQMSRYAAGFLFNHRALAEFDYIIKLDPDVFTGQKWSGDPFQGMLDKKIGYWVGMQDAPYVTKNLGETIKQFLKEKNLTLKHPEMIFDKDGNYRSSSYYGCFVGMATSVARSQEYRELFTYLDSRGGWFRRRWDEQKLFALYAALYLEKHEVEFFSYVKIIHQDALGSQFFGP